MDQKTVAFARHWAKRYVRTKHPYGLDAEDVENRILESLYKYSRGKFPAGTDPNSDPAVKEALAEALNAVQNEGRRNLRALCPWQVRNAEPHHEAQACRNLACDMRRLRIRQSVRERDRLAVRRTVARLSPEDRRMAELYMKLLNWKKVAAALGLAMWTFRHHVLPGFVSRFKATWTEEAF